MKRELIASLFMDHEIRKSHRATDMGHVATMKNSRYLSHLIRIRGRKPVGVSETTC